MWRGVLAVSALALSLICCAAAGVLAYVPERELVQGFRSIFAIFAGSAQLAMVVSAAAAAAIGIAFAGLFVSRSFSTHQVGRLQVQQARALARSAENEASKSGVLSIVAKHDEQVHIRDLDKSASWRPAHVDPRLYANGRPGLPNQVELALWDRWQQQARPALPGPPPPLLTPGPGYELPQMVRWFDLVPGHQGNINRLVLGVRLTEAGRLAPVTVSLYDLFHTIIAASSGWGKSVFANAILAQLATCQEPVEFVLIDQQMHGLAAFKNCDRLRYPLLREPGEILSALAETHGEASRRSELFARCDADDLADYNRRADEPLPPVIVAVDEAAALLANKEVGAELKRQAWELRKFGIYQILCLTSAKGTTIDTDHRQQFSSKVQLHANDRHQARLLLDAPEAVEFPPGRAVIELPGQPPAVVQTPYIDRREVRALLRPRPGEAPPPPPTWDVVEGQPPPTAKQQQVLDLWDAGERSETAIARQVYGDGGGRQCELVHRTLEKFNRSPEV